MADWIISANPQYFDVINAFRDLGKVEWGQKSHIAAGDMVYVYVSKPVQAIKFCCKVNKINIETPDKSDTQYNLIEEDEEYAGKYMELEMLEEYEASAFSYQNLKSFGFQPPRRPVHLNEAIKKFIYQKKETAFVKREQIEFDKNLILYGPPGTGKTYKTVIYAVAICDRKPLAVVEAEEYSAVMRRYEELKAEHRIAFTTFHQSYGYEEFIEGIKPIVNEENGDITYEVKPGVFKRFCNDAKIPVNSDSNRNTLAPVETDSIPYVFIIDEINRGNISKIFGELITLVEDTKRAGMPEEASAILPYSEESFSVPRNVYLLGTMNTADRSIALMDTALRRRFRFVEMMPDAEVLRKIHADRIEDLDVAAMLEKINDRITFLYDREHTIGHAFFAGLRGKNATLENLKGVFEKSVIPLLQEYFYEDYRKIRLVLGDNGKTDPELQFVKEEKVPAKSVFKGSVEDVADLPEERYIINKKAFETLESYKQIL